MKPIVVKETYNGKIDITAEELQKIVEEAYEQGKADASTRYYPYYPYSGAYPKITYLGGIVK
jgi:hypothetical protein